jgi:lipid-binding SYLF domain-containing protein
MKRLGILFGLLLLAACMVFAQDNTSSSSDTNNADNTAQNNSSTTTTSTTTTKNDNDTSANSANSSADQNTSQDSANQARKNAASRDDDAAMQEKEQAKNAPTKQGSDRDKAIARLDDAAKDIDQLLAAPDNGIPDSVFTKAKCVAVVPSMIKGGFVFGAEHGRGVASCRLPNGGWSAPAFFEMTGGNWGAQIGVEGVDLTMLIMNQDGMNQLLSSKWKIGGNASASAGPVGREAAADTNIKFNSEVLTYSRARGLYAGATINGANIKPDEDAMRAYYGRTLGFIPVLTGKVKDPHSHDVFTAALHKNRQEVNAQAH